jgi:hypothetical protein
MKVLRVAKLEDGWRETGIQMLQNRYQNVTGNASCEAFPETGEKNYVI